MHFPYWKILNDDSVNTITYIKLIIFVIQLNQMVRENLKSNKDRKNKSKTKNA